MTVGHWSTIEEAQKLTQSQLIPGVVEELVFREPVIGRLAVALARGKSIKWNRENYDLSADVQNVDVGEQITWTSSVTYDAQETELKRKAIARVLDAFIPDVYGTINNYEAQVLWEAKKGIFVKLNDTVIYDDITFGATDQMDGLHALAAIQTGTTLDIDNSNFGLSLQNLRTQMYAMKHGVGFIYMPIEIGIRMDAAYEERGFVALKYDTAGAFSLLTRGIDALGQPIMYFMGKPIIRTDYLVAENPDVGDGLNLRTKKTAGATANYSIFLISAGDIFAGNPGLTMGFGNPEMVNQLYKVEYFDKLEDFDASGIRVITYTAPLLGSKLCLGRIFDITDAAVTA